MAKMMTLAKRWFTREEADEYGDVDEDDNDNPDNPDWVVTFPDDPPHRKGRGRAWGRGHNT